MRAQEHPFPDRRLAVALCVAAAIAACVPAVAAPARAQEPSPGATAVRAHEPLVPLQTGLPTAPAPGTPTAPPLPSASRTATAVAPTADAGATAVSPVKREERPIIVVRDYSVDPSRPSAGSTFTLRLVLANVGEHFAENVRVSLSSVTFFPVGTGAMPMVNKLPEGEETTVDVAMQVAAGTEGGPHSLTLGLSWDDSYGGTYSDDTTIGIEVSAAATRPVVVVAAARLPGRVAPGVPFNLCLDLVNTGALDARNVVVVLSGAPLAPTGGATGAPIVIPPGGTANVNLRVIAAALAEPGAAAQTIELRYDGPGGQRYTDAQTVGLVVSGDAAVAPLPIVDAYELRPTELHPGEVFQLRLTVTNVGTADAQQTRLVIGGAASTSSAATGAGGSTTGTGSGAAVVAPVGTGNVRYLDRLAPAASRDVDQQMVVSNSAKPGVYGLEIGIVYLDMFGQLVQDSQLVTLLVSRRVEIEINPVDVITSTVVGQALPFGLEVINTGTDDVNVTTAEIQAGRYMTVDEGTQYIGPLEGGAPYALSTTLRPRAPTTDAVVKVIVHYIDDFGREQTVERDFRFDIADGAPTVALAGAAPEPAEAGPVRRILFGLLGLGASPRDAAAAPAVEGRPPGAAPIEGGAPAAAPVEPRPAAPGP